jgi:hypothetical protein
MEPIEPVGIPAVPFTSAEAQLWGIPPKVLRRNDIEGISHGLYRPVGWDFELSSAARALCAATPGAWISHTTAAQLHGLILPPWLSDSHELHLSKPRQQPQARRKGIIAHNTTALPGEVEIDGGLRISSRPRTWLEMARNLSLEELVCMGDQLIRIPRPQFEGRDTAFATPASLRSLLERHRNLQGIVRARSALELMRVGADSAPETLLRLAMNDAGLPEPDLQLTLWNRENSPSADLGYRARRIALQYDGAHHLSEEQRHSDRRRDNAFEAAGWTVLIFTQADVADGFRDAVGRIKRALRHAWVDPAVTSGFASGN